MNTQFRFFVSLLLGIVLLASCNGPLEQPQNVTVEPNPLKLVGTSVECTISGVFPAKKFSKKGVLKVTPVLVYEGGEALAEQQIFVGEKATENGQVVPYKTGGSYSIGAHFDFVPAMEKSELYLRFEGVNGKKTVEIPDLKIADGVIVTQNRAEVSNVVNVIAPDKFQKVIQEMQEADIHFLIQQSNLRDSELRKEKVKKIQETLKNAKGNQKMSVSKFTIDGYASPDGGETLNTKLATARQKNAQTYIARELKKNKIEADLTGEITAEDWVGFQKKMEASSIQDKELVLRVLNMYSDPEERETQIKNLATVYKAIAKDILPELRRSRLKLTLDLIGKSDDEIKALLESNPSELTVEEMLYGATLMEDNDSKMKVYLTVTSTYPEDYRAFNNVGMLEFEKGNYESANRSYLKANELNPDNPDVNFNLAVVSLVLGDLDKAEVYLGNSAGTSGDYNTVRGTIYTLRGEYDAAQQAYKNPSNSYAVQMILSEDYAAAREILDKVERPNATTAYLKAIVGARTNDRELVYQNLKEAIEQDETFKTKAQNDIEFAKFVEDEEYKNIIN